LSVNFILYLRRSEVYFLMNESRCLKSFSIEPQMPKSTQKIFMLLATYFLCISNIYAADRPVPITLEVLGRSPITVHTFTPLDTPKGVLVALHGCGGLLSINDKNGDMLSARHAAMAKFANQLGWVAVFPDSFTARGRREICTQKFSERTIKQGERRADALATLQWVREQPWFAANKEMNSVLLGWSNGGTTVLQTIETKFDPSILITHAIAFYPGCSQQLARDYSTHVPLTLFLGGKDDWTAPGPCIALGKRIHAQVYVYPDAHHGFDSPVGKVRLRTEVPNGVHPGQGVHVGPDQASREDAYAKLAALLGRLSR